MGLPNLAINKLTVNINSLCLESALIGPSQTLEGSAGSVRIISQVNATHTHTVTLIPKKTPHTHTHSENLEGIRGMQTKKTSLLLKVGPV